MDKGRILVVEDETIVAIDLTEKLESLGYAVTAAVSSGQEAIHKAAEKRPDLVLMDVRLKGEMDGIQASEQIRARFDIPVIFLTAYSDEATIQRAKITEPFGYLLKPFEERELHSAIEISLYKHQTEKRLKQSERWLAATLEGIGDAVIATDANGCIKFMNSVAEALTGWTQQEAWGKTCEEVFHIIHQETRGLVDSPVRRVLQEGVTVGLRNHTLLIARDDSEIPIDDSAAPIRDDSGNITGVVVVFRDVTERVQAEEAQAKLIAELQEALVKVKTLSGLLPICTSCKKIRDDQGYWQQVEVYVQQHSDAEFTHGFCPDCARTLYPEIFGDDA